VTTGQDRFREDPAPPKIDPSVPLKIARPRLEPIDRTALFEAASTSPS